MFHFILCMILLLSYNLIDSFVTLPEYSYIFFYLIMLFILKDKLFINSKDQNLLKGNQSENLDLDKIELEKEQDNKLIFNSDENLNDEVIVTIIATGFDKKKNAGNLYKEGATTQTRRDTTLDDTDDDDGSQGGNFEPSEIDIPRFLQHKNF